MNFYGPMVSTVDFPGALCVTVFTMGCNLRCPICHNPKLVLPEMMDDVMEHQNVDQVVAFAEGRWADGICITGGEPTLHYDLPPTIERMRDLSGIMIKLDTNGSNPAMLKQLFGEGALDYVALDVKAPLQGDRISTVCGIPAERGRRYLDLLRESIELIRDSGIKYQFRTVCCEHFLSPEDVGEIAREIAPAMRYELLPFKPHNTLDPKMLKESEATLSYMQACLTEAQKYISDAVIER